jgi:hypothetical protein
MQGLWNWLAGATCGCGDALDNGTALLITPRADFARVQHQVCETRTVTLLPWAPGRVWLTDKRCRACDQPLISGGTILVAPGRPVRHLTCRVIPDPSG